MLFKTRYFLDWFIGCIFPEPCWKCGDLTASVLCSSCIQDLSWKIQPNRYRYLDKVYSLFFYDAWIQSVLYGIKYGRKKNDATRLGACLALSNTNLQTVFTQAVCVPVPLSASRKQDRGFNQVYVLFDPLIQVVQLPWVLAVERVVDTPPLFDLSPTIRQKMLSNAFQYTAVVVPHTVIVLDDILTTGATLDEVARVIKCQGVKRVIGITLAYV